MALSTTEEDQVRDLLAKLSELLNLANSEPNIISKLAAPKVTLDDLPAATVVNPSDVTIIRQAGVEKKLTYSLFADTGLRTGLASTTLAGEGANRVGFSATRAATSGSVEAKLQQRPSPLDAPFNAAGNGTTNDNGVFTTFQSSFSGRLVDLGGRSFVVNSYPTGNVYTNGNFVISGVTYPAAQNRTIISTNTGDTLGIETAYSGGIQNTLSISGRSTADLWALIASQNSRAAGPARAVVVGSIYSYAKGNVSGVYSSRQTSALVPQSAALASEECEGWGTRSVNISSVFSRTEGLMGANISSRRAYTNNLECSANVASRDAMCGAGQGALFTVTISGGQVTGVTIVNGGASYILPTLNFYDRSGAGSGAAATLTVTGGVITGVTVTNPGSGYSANVDAIAQVSEQCMFTAASRNVIARGNVSAVVACEVSEAVGFGAGVYSSRGGSVSGQSSAVIASGTLSAVFGNIQVSGDNCAAIATQDTTIAGSLNVVQASWISGIPTGVTGAAVVASRRVSNAVTRSMAGGNGASGPASTANRKWHIFSDTGNIQIAGTLTQSATFTDVAKMFENATYGEIPVGAMVTWEGRKVRLAQEGDREVSAHTRTPAVLLGDSTFTWSGRYVTGEFGETVLAEQWDEDAGEHILMPVENEEYDPSAENLPRSERRAEWTPVCLVGEVHVRVSADVDVDDYVEPSTIPGLGRKASEPTRMRCMEIRQPFNASKGYAVALCLRA